MPKSQEYICPRCDYKTLLKKCIKQHFYALKNPCPNKNNLLLTEEIKLEVLSSHYYFKSSPVNISTNNNNDVGNNHIHYNTNYNNYIANLDSAVKLNSYLEYNKKAVTDINDYMEKQHEKTLAKMETDRQRVPHTISADDFLLLVDGMVKINNRCYEEMNVIYDEILDRIKIYCDGEWTVFMIEPGLRRIVDILRSNYLDQYECYLYKKLFYDKHINGYNLNTVRIHLDEYYKFLAIFDHVPSVNKEEIINIVPAYKTENPDEFREFGMKNYDAIKKDLSKSEVTKTKKRVLEIIKRNHKLNLKLLNESILELITLDQDFKNSFLSLNKTIIG